MISFLRILPLTIIITSCSFTDFSYFDNYTKNTVEVSDGNDVTKNLIKESNEDKLKKKIVNVSNCSGIDLDVLSVENFSPSKEIISCLNSSPEFYSYLLFIYEYNAKKANKKLQKFIKNNPKQSLSLNSVVEIADKRLLAWLNKKTNVAEPILIIPVPVKRTENVVIKQKEFETTAEFNARVEKQRKALQQKIQQEQEIYKNKLAKYNREQKLYRAALSAEKIDRNQQSKAKYLEFLIEEIKIILGNPYIDKMSYHADEEVFNARLASTKSSWNENIVIEVPIENAKEFKKGIKEVIPVLGFDLDDQGKLFISSIVARFDSRDYVAKVKNIGDATFRTQNIEVKFGDWL